jgi:methyl-accepting chemotaxis protein
LLTVIAKLSKLSVEARDSLNEIQNKPDELIAATDNLIPMTENTSGLPGQLSNQSEQISEINNMVSQARTTIDSIASDNITLPSIYKGTSNLSNHYPKITFLGH